MKILDLRPRSVRLMSRLWSRGSSIRGRLAGDPGPMNLPARWAAGLADGMMSRRVAGRQPKAERPAVVSVGNLALGGTGKTPVVISLALGLADSGRRGAVLTRGFGSRLEGPLVVAPDNILAGDEARLMAGALAQKGWPVIQAQERWRGMELLLVEHRDLDVVIVEDGHQTAKVQRDLDILILDAWVVEKGTGLVPGPGYVRPYTGPVMPLGPWRESAQGADRAGIWVLETADDDLPAGREGQTVATFQRHLTLKYPEGRNRECPWDRRYAVLSGIARPEAFEKSLGSVLTHSPALAIRCGDHAEYAPSVVRKIINAVEGSGAEFVVTTAKDWVKLEPFWPVDAPVVVADLEIRWGNGQTLPALVGERLWS